jgi:2-polyprenyl-6-methoxyphenol hydroxylase-like FAD-dependent oxidoreductase
MPKTTFHVIVIGAGTGGMCLAHGLRKAGVSVAVYERDRTRSEFLQGFRVGINPDGTRALRECLPPELFDTFLATCAAPMRRGNLYTEKLSEVCSLSFPLDRDPLNSEHSVSRVTLRQVLLTGAEDFVHYGKRFVRYERNEDGTVTAFFEDGSTATGDILVAADGTRSRVRQQYLPQARLVAADVAGGAGKVPLTDEVRALLPPHMLDGMSVILAPKGYFFIMHVMEFPWDREGAVKSGVDEELIRTWPGLLFDNTRDHVIWGLAAPTGVLPADLGEVTGVDAIEMAKRMTAGWSPTLHRLFELSDPSACAISNVSQSTSVPIPQWDTTTITLLGDAIHTMTPGRGVGANTALRDARLLCRNLARASRGDWTVLDGIRDYETKMIDYGFQAVRDSLRNHGKDNPLQKPVVGDLMLAGLRGGARVVNILPPVKRKLVNTLLHSRGADRD